MYECKNNLVDIVELNSTNEDDLFHFMRNNLGEYRQIISDQYIPDNQHSFRNLIKKWFRNGRNYQFLIYKNNTKKVLGTIFFYNQNNKTIQMSAFFKREIRGTIYTSKSLLLVIYFAYNIIKVNNIIISIFKENEHMLTIADKLCLKQTKTLSSSNSKITYFMDEDIILKLLRKIK